MSPVLFTVTVRSAALSLTAVDAAPSRISPAVDELPVKNSVRSLDRTPPWLTGLKVNAALLGVTSKVTPEGTFANEKLPELSVCVINWVLLKLRRTLTPAIDGPVPTGGWVIFPLTVKVWP